jgi:hypothetical protein
MPGPACPRQRHEQRNPDSRPPDESPLVPRVEVARLGTRCDDAGPSGDERASISQL